MHARQLVHEAGHAAQFLHLLDLAEEVFQIEALALLELAGDLLGFLLVDLLLRLLHQAEDVAHAEDARGDALGVEGLEGIGLLPHAEEFDGLAGDVADGEGGAAARVAVHLGEDDAGEGQGLVEGARGVGGVLAGHGVHHEQGLHRLHGLVQAADLGHHRLVHVQAAGGVQQEHVVEVAAGVFHRRAADLHRVLVGAAGEEVHPHFGGEGLELVDGRRAMDVGAGHQDLFLLPLA